MSWMSKQNVKKKQAVNTEILHHWTEFFDASIIAQGTRLFRNGTVEELKLSTDMLFAQVVKNSKREYVKLTWAERRDTAFISLYAECTCSKCDFCEHTAAVLLTWLERERKQQLPPLMSIAEIDIEIQNFDAICHGDDALDLEDEDLGDGEDDDDEDGPLSGFLSPLARLHEAIAAEEKRKKSVPAAAKPAPVDPLEQVPAIVLAEGAAVGHQQQEWLSNLTVAASTEVSLVAVLSFHKIAGWQISPLQIKPRKDGRWGVGKRYRSWRDLLMGDLSRLSVPVQRLARQAAAWQAGAYGEDGLLRYADSNQLEAAITAGVLAMEPVQHGPLALGPTHVGGFAWKKSDDGWCLEIEVPGLPPDAGLARLERIWWVSSGLRQLGRVELPIGEEVLNHLSNMPYLPLALVAGAAEQLRRLWPDMPPPPAAPQPAVPVPVLRTWRGVLQTMDWQRKQQSCELGLVSFRYGTIEVAAKGPVAINHSKGTLVRHLEAESARLAEVARAGLAPVSSSSLLEILKCPYRRDAVFRHVTESDLPLSGMAMLRASGWEISGLPVADIPISDLTGLAAEVSEEGGWFDLALGTDIDGQRIDLVPLLTPLLGAGPQAWDNLPTVDGCLLVPHGRERLLRVPLRLLQGLHDHLMALFSRERSGPWKLNAWDAGVISALDGLGVRVLGADRLRTIATALAAPLVPAAQPAELKAELRPYQREGLAWLQRLQAIGLGGVLADDMGLGKTVQLIAHLVVEQQAGRLDRPCLVVCPASLIGTWQREISRFAPTLTPQIMHGTRRDLAGLVPGAIGITTYGVLSRDIGQLEKIPLHIAVCDEAQVVKNAGTKAAQALRRLDARQRLCLTGTPLENHLGELHAQLAWAAPGLFGARTTFDEVYAKPIQEGVAGRAEALRRRLKAVLLRRTKQQVATDLPPRSESIVTIELGTKQRALYESIRLAMDKRIRDVIAAKGLARSGIEVIEALLRLRQAACDPNLLGSPEGLACGESGKLEHLAEMLPTLVEEGRRILLFSQFTSFLDRIEEVVLKPAGLPWLRLDGQTRDRQDLVDRFQAKEVPLFLLSLKAGGTGLTLTAADTVILADPWWNPAVEAQAADRAHRIGQTQPVLIYRLVAASTIEEKVVALQARKKALADALYDESGQSLGSLRAEDLAALLAPM